jgi:hypothetical protein
MREPARFLRFALHAPLYLIPAEAGNRHALPTARFAADDPYPANRHVKEITEERFQGVIGGVVDRGGPDGSSISVSVTGPLPLGPACACAGFPWPRSSSALAA